MIQFPGVERTCFVCVHFDEIESPEDHSISSWCSAYSQPIDSEAYEAEDCPTFEIDREKA